MSVGARAVRTQLLAIQNHARQVQETGSPSLDEVANPLSEYDNARTNCNKILSREKVDLDLRFLGEITQGRFYVSGELMGKLRGIEIECLKGAEALAGIIVLIPKEDMDKLDSIRKELRELSHSLTDVNFETNVTQAIDEYEKGHVLASALISSRVIMYALDKVPGEKDDEKIEFLQEKGIIEKGRKDVRENILKASKKSRNFTSHDIRIFPSSSEALSLLGDTLGILKLITKLG